MTASSNDDAPSDTMAIRTEAEDERSARRREILEVAARLFQHGSYDSVGMRQIAEAAGILGGSLYHHFSSKQEIFIEVHRAALAQSSRRILSATEGVANPWRRLEAAIAAQLEGQLDPNSITWPMINDRSALSGAMRAALVKERDAFEEIYRDLIDDLPLPARIDRSVTRINLLAMLNAVTTWYRPGLSTPEQIATQIVRILQPVDSSPI